MSRLDDVLRYKKQIETAEHQIAQAQGRLHWCMVELRKRFKCDDLESGQALLISLRRKVKEAQQKAERKLAAFEKKWKDKLK